MNQSSPQKSSSKSKSKNKNGRITLSYFLLLFFHFFKSTVPNNNNRIFGNIPNEENSKIEVRSEVNNTIIAFSHHSGDHYHK